MFKVILALVAAVAVLLAIVAQWRIRVAVRFGKLRRGSPNKMALRRWSVVECMARFAKQDAPEQAYWIAQKARFSQHTVTHEELRKLADTIDSMHAQLKRHGLHKRLYYTLILALY